MIYKVILIDNIFVTKDLHDKNKKEFAILLAKKLRV